MTQPNNIPNFSRTSKTTALTTQQVTKVIAGPRGPAGAPGQPITIHQGGGGALPNGGTTGQMLVKASNADGDVAWGELAVIDGGWY